jgi:Zn-dependent protease/CBS domain-containing protein
MMFGNSITLFRLFGFEVKVDLSWVVLAVLITWSLARGVFPTTVRGLSTATYWWMGALGAVGLFLSVVFHELWHSLVARRFGIVMSGITLFIFGGVAQMEDEPKDPRAEFWMAAAGPLSSIFIGLILYGVARAFTGVWPRPLLGVVGYLGYLNLILAVFNLVPAFPLDGGRILRSVLWGARKDLLSATRIASRVGAGFGLLLMFAGLVSMLLGSFISGIWWLFIGTFLRGAANSSYQETVRRRTLQGEKARSIMRPDPITVTSLTTVRQLVEDYIYRYHYTLFPVVDDGRLKGCVTTRDVRNVPRGEWDMHQVSELSATCTDGTVVEPDLDALAVLQKMRRTGNTRMMVVGNGRLLGIITLKDLLSFIAVRLEIGQ